MADKDTTLEASVLPALLEVLSGIGGLSKIVNQNHVQQLEALKVSMMPDEWKTVLLNIDRKLKEDGVKDAELTDALKKLVEVMTPVNKQLVSLTQSTNELVELQRQQNQQIANLVQSFVENTSRMDVLTIAVQNATKDEPLKAVYDDLQGGK